MSRSAAAALVPAGRTPPPAEAWLAKRVAYDLVVRLAGVARDARGLGVHDHLSWPYEDRADFCRHVVNFVSDGLALGLRCVYAGAGGFEALKDDLSSLPGLEEKLDRGALILNSLADLYEEGQPVDPDETLATFAGATEEAIEHGYRGLRSAGDATALVRTPEQVAAFAAWEYRADRYMCGHPFSGMCGFDRTQVPMGATVALACMHPNAPEGATPFRLYTPDSDADLALAGEIDLSIVHEFGSGLDRTGLEVSDEFLVDGTELEFVDHRGLLTIRDFARRSGAAVVLRTRSGLPGRLIELLDLEGIRVERPTHLAATA